MKRKLFSLLIIFSILISTQFPVFAQTSAQKNYYPAVLLEKDKKNIKRKNVSILHEENLFRINSKDAKIAKSFLISDIKSADYSYSDKPQIKEAIGAAILSGGWFIPLAFLLSKTKRHWLVLTTKDEAVFLELEKDSYRMLLLEMAANGIKVEDLGDKDAK